MYQLPKQADEKHDFASSEEHGGEIHISRAKKSGRLDYFCLGCKKPMQAILRKLYGAKPYFRHDTKDVVPGERCTFRDEEHRRKLALITVELEKALYLPPLYKFPPKGVEGPVIPLAGGQMFYAAKVTKYQHFYEDKAGNVKIATTFDPQKDNLLFVADLVLYDEDEQPVLLVTLNRPRKSDIPEVQAALARLRINTLYLTIPQDSPENIHRSLMNGKNAKWLYHDDERQFDYLSLSAGFTSGVPAIDAEPGQLFEESFDCRKVQINNLIRALEGCLGAEQYRTAERRAREAVGKTRLAITRAEEQRDSLADEHRARLEEQHQPEFDGIGERGRLLDLAFGQLRDRKENVEGRYRAENSRLAAAASQVANDLRAAALAAGGTGSTIEELEDDLTRSHDQAITRLGNAFSYGIRFAQGETKRIDNRIADAETNDSRLRSRKKQLSVEFGKRYEAESKLFEEETRFEDSETERTEATGNQRSATFTALQRQVDADFNATYPTNDAGLPAALDHILSDGPLNIAAQAHSDFIRHRKAKEFLGTPAFQAWLSQYQR